MSRLAVALIALIALALPSAAIATTDRTDYAAQVNAVCASAPGNDLAELAALRTVPAAPGDEGTVLSWLDARENRLNLAQELKQIDRQVNKLQNRTRKTLDIDTLIRIDRKVRKLDRRANRVESKLIAAETQDDALGAELGATACVIDIQ